MSVIREIHQAATHSVVRPEVVDLLLPARAPEILANELDRIEGIREEATIVAQA